MFSFSSAYGRHVCTFGLWLTSQHLIGIVFQTWNPNNWSHCQKASMQSSLRLVLLLQKQKAQHILCHLLHKVREQTEIL